MKVIVFPIYQEIAYLDKGVYEAAGKIFKDNASRPLNYHFALTQINHLPVFLTLDHSWALLCWVSFTKTVRRQLAILHLDAHDDLQTPFLAYQGADCASVTAPITNRKFNLTEPADCFDAIAYGNIGIGSFILPFIAQQQKTYFIHIKEDHKKELKKARKELYYHEKLFHGNPYRQIGFNEALKMNSTFFIARSPFQML